MNERTNQPTTYITTHAYMNHTHIYACTYIAHRQMYAPSVIKIYLYVTDLDKKLFFSYSPPFFFSLLGVSKAVIGKWFV